MESEFEELVTQRIKEPVSSGRGDMWVSLGWSCRWSGSWPGSAEQGLAPWLAWPEGTWGDATPVMFPAASKHML